MTVLLSKGLPKSVKEVAPGYQRWGASDFGGAMLSERYRTLAYEEIFRSQPGVYSVVSRLLEGICRIPIKTYAKGDEGTKRPVHPNSSATWGEISNDPVLRLANLMETPWYGHDQWDLKARNVFDLLVHGKFLNWKLRPGQGQPPAEIWPIPWWCVIPISDSRGIQQFNIYLDGTLYSLAPEDVIYRELPGGISPLDPLRRSIGIEDRAMDWQDEALANGLSARAVFTTKANLAQKAQTDAIREQLDLLYSGPTGKQYAVLGEGSDIKVLSGLSAVDLGLIQARQSSREDVCACYNTNPSLLGFSTSATSPTTYASVVEWRRAFYQDAVGPKVVMVEGAYQSQLVRVEPLWAGAELKFDMTELVAPDPESQARADLMDMQSGTTTINRRMMRRGDAPIGDPTDPNNPANLPWIAGNGYPLGFAPEHVVPVVEPPAGEQAQATAAAVIAEAIHPGGK